MQPFKTKRNDTKPFLDVLEKETAPGSKVYAPINLTGCTVKFFLARILASGTRVALFGGAAQIVPPGSNGMAAFYPTEEQMALEDIPVKAYPLLCGREWEITYGDGVVETIPAKGTLKTIVDLDLG